VAAALLHDAKNCRKTQPGALAPLLGREKGLEDAGLGRLVHAHSGVRHREQYVGAWFDAIVRLGVRRVQLQICRLDRPLWSKLLGMRVGY
jgi:hypothetical protein